MMMNFSSPQLVGILNITPDSYWDGGKYVTAASIEKRIHDMTEEGADGIDIGGESTGPNSPDVSAEEEWNRIAPAIEIVKRIAPQLFISIDTTKADVATHALRAGAHMINDVSAGRSDPEMFRVIAGHGCPYVMMYSKDDSPRTTINEKQYEDVVMHIRNFLKDRIDAARAHDIHPDCIIVDPGLGHFVSSDAKYSWDVLFHLEAFADLAPVFVSPSRKSFLAGPKKLPTAERLEATLAATAIALEHGAWFIRTHDVAATRKVVDMLAVYR